MPEAELEGLAIPIACCAILISALAESAVFLTHENNQFLDRRCGGIGFGFDVRDLADDDPGSSVRQRWRQRCASVVVGGNGDTNAVTALGG